MSIILVCRNSCSVSVVKEIYGGFCVELILKVAVSFQNVFNKSLRLFPGWVSWVGEEARPQAHRQ